MELGREIIERLKQVMVSMADHGYHAQVKGLGIPDRWIDHGTQPELSAECGFDVKAVALWEMLPMTGARTAGYELWCRGARA